MEKREKGTVKWFSTSKGYGFIVRDQGEDIFVHYSGIREKGYRSLKEGQRLKYQVVTGKRGLKAEDVIILSSERSFTFNQSLLYIRYN